MDMTKVQAQAKAAAERLSRTQIIKAMERLIIGLGGKHAFITWLEAMPEDMKFNNAGGLDQSTVMEIASNDDLYNKVLKAFANHMGPVLMGMKEDA